MLLPCVGVCVGDAMTGTHGVGAAAALIVCVSVAAASLRVCVFR